MAFASWLVAPEVSRFFTVDRLVRDPATYSHGCGIGLLNSTSETGQAISTGSSDPTIQRWSAKWKVELLLSLIKGEKELVEVEDSTT